MHKRNRQFTTNFSQQDLAECALKQEKATWLSGTISYWDDEKGRGYIQPLKTTDFSPYENGWYYFTYTTLTERKYSPKVGDEVNFRIKRVDWNEVAEIMEVVL